jgi:hypothetical protein
MIYMTEPYLSGNQGASAMIRNAVRAATVLLATLAIPTVLFAAPLPASAAGDTLCETYGSYCVGSADLNLYTAMDERNPGRNLIETPLGGTYDGHPTYYIQFSADATKCVSAATPNFVRVVIHACGANGTVWAKVDISTGVFRWISRYASEQFGSPLDLGGFNSGSNYFIDAVGVPGAFYSFSWI